ncbi:MAG: hypothetical protein LUE64_01725 [Candidatus Gastranaerophilales bacterium]|nr:hypothetical protein [Candidatus Gastranaerophilales bacterium]
MNEDTKKILKITGLLFAAGVIGGFVGGLMACGCHACKCHGPHMGAPAPMHQQFRGQTPGGFEGKFVEEDFVVIPNQPGSKQGKDFKKPEGSKFDKPLPPKAPNGQKPMPPEGMPE